MWSAATGIVTKYLGYSNVFVGITPNIWIISRVTLITRLVAALDIKQIDPPGV